MKALFSRMLSDSRSAPAGADSRQEPVLPTPALDEPAAVSHVPTVWQETQAEQVSHVPTVWQETQAEPERSPSGAANGGGRKAPRSEPRWSDSQAESGEFDESDEGDDDGGGDGPAAPLDIESALFSWLIDSPIHPDAQPGGRERRALQRLDHIAADPASHYGLLPRAAAVVPQLMARLRDASASSNQLTQFVARDVTLVAEVIRTANSPYYRRGDAIVELHHAIRAIGVVGLQSAIARSLLKPVFQASGGTLVTRSAKRLWAHTEFKAQLCAAVARIEGVDPFEGYLAGLVHDAVWSAVLRTLDGVESAEPWSFNPGVVMALGLRRDRLFEIITKHWKLSTGLTDLASDVARRGLLSATTKAGHALATADRLASLLCLPDQAAWAEAWLERLGPSVRECYENMIEQQGETGA
jgi:HDOD domain